MHSTNSLIKRYSTCLKNKIQKENTEYLKELINKNCPELIVLQNVKKMMISGEVQIEGLSSKHRQYLHELAEKFDIEHYSIGNYNNRIIVLKDKLHKIFPSDDYKKYDLNQTNQIRKQIIDEKKEEQESKNYKEELENDEDESESHEDNEESNEDDEESDKSDEEYDEETDTYDSEDDSDYEEEKVQSSKFDNFSVGEKCIYMLSIFNILISSYTLVTVSKFVY